MINKEFMSTAAVGVALAFSSMVFAPDTMAESADCSQFSGKIEHACEVSNELVEINQKLVQTQEKYVQTQENFKQEKKLLAIASNRLHESQERGDRLTHAFEAYKGAISDVKQGVITPDEFRNTMNEIAEETGISYRDYIKG